MKSPIFRQKALIPTDRRFFCKKTKIHKKSVQYNWTLFGIGFEKDYFFFPFALSAAAAS